MKSPDLQRRKEQLRALRDRLTGTIRHVEEAALQDVQKGGEISGYHTHLADADEEGFDKEIALAQNEGDILEMVENALQQIDAGTYGICQECNEPIPAERLEAIPYTTFCVSCAQRA